MTLQELMAFIAAVLWAMLWWPVGRVFGWWCGVAGCVAGGFLGLVIGFMLGEWREFMRPGVGWIRSIIEVAGFVLAWVVFVGLPIWVLSLVRLD